MLLGVQRDPPDFFSADKGWFHVNLLTLGRTVSRGAKSGSREHYGA
jgi:hypothetical protein